MSSTGRASRNMEKGGRASAGMVSDGDVVGAELKIADDREDIES